MKVKELGPDFINLVTDLNNKDPHELNGTKEVEEFLASIVVLLPDGHIQELTWP